MSLALGWQDSGEDQEHHRHRMDVTFSPPLSLSPVIFFPFVFKTRLGYESKNEILFRLGKKQGNLMVTFLYFREGKKLFSQFIKVIDDQL